MNDILARFTELNNKYHHGRHDYEEWNSAHKEMFQLAQVIAQVNVPNLQSELTDARKEVMVYISKHEPPIFTTDKLMAPRNGVRFRWSEIQITPEVFLNPGVTGARVPKIVADRLIRLHRTQVRYILEITRR